MVDCLICRKYDDRLAEQIAHQVLKEIVEEQGFWWLAHVEPNSKRDKQGKDFFIVAKRGERALPIQIKAFRILSKKDLKSKLDKIKQGPSKFKYERAREFWKTKFETIQKLKNYILETIEKYQQLDLLINDQEIKQEFEKAIERSNLNKALNSDDYDFLLGTFGAIEHFIDIFNKAIIHASRYPSVKMFFAVDVSTGMDKKELKKKLKTEWTALIMKLIQRNN